MDGLCIQGTGNQTNIIPVRSLRKDPRAGGEECSKAEKNRKNAENHRVMSLSWSKIRQLSASTREITERTAPSPVLSFVSQHRHQGTCALLGHPHQLLAQQITLTLRIMKQDRDKGTASRKIKGETKKKKGETRDKRYEEVTGCWEASVRGYQPIADPQRAAGGNLGITCSKGWPPQPRHHRGSAGWSNDFVSILLPGETFQHLSLAQQPLCSPQEQRKAKPLPHGSGPLTWARSN